MPLDTDLLDLLACPSDDHAPLRELTRDGADVLVCTFCASVFPITDGIPVLLLDEATPGPNGPGVRAPADALPPMDALSSGDALPSGDALSPGDALSSGDALSPAPAPAAEPAVDDTRLDGAAVPAEVDDAERGDPAPDAGAAPGQPGTLDLGTDDGEVGESLGESIDGEWVPRHAIDDGPRPSDDAGGRSQLRRPHNGRP